MPWLIQIHALVDPALLLARLGVGVMFALSGYYKLTDASRRAAMRQSLDDAGFPTLLAAPLASVELIAGLALALGLMGALSAAALLAISLAALVTTTLPKTEGEGIHKLENLLYSPEALLASILLVLMATGAGRWSLDQAIFGF